MWVPRSARHEAGERELALDPRDLGVGALNARPHCGIRHPAARGSVVIDSVLYAGRAGPGHAAGPAPGGENQLDLLGEVIDPDGRR